MSYALRMTLIRSLPALLALLLLAGDGAGDTGDALRLYADSLRARAAEIKQGPSLLRWQQIPWVTDLMEGVQLARQEHRPMFLWTTGDDPLGRC
jgi:hypothetical protein